jgi:hypothetical protein
MIHFTSHTDIKILQLLTENTQYTDVKDWSLVCDQLHNLRASGNIVSPAGATHG